jgi:hypothetical protein
MGDGEEDLVSFADFVGPDYTRAYFDAYRKNFDVRPGFEERVVLQLLRRLIMTWGWGLEQNKPWLPKTGSFRDFAEPALERIKRAL